MTLGIITCFLTYNDVKCHNLFIRHIYNFLCGPTLSDIKKTQNTNTWIKVLLTNLSDYLKLIIAISLIKNIMR